MSDLKYDSLDDGQRVEYEDFWNSGLLSWKKGKVQVSESGKYFIPDDKILLGKVISSHRMHHLRKEESNV